MDTQNTEDDLRTRAEFKKKPVLYCLLTLPDGKQFNVVMEIEPKMLDAIGPFPQVGKRSLEAVYHLLEARHKQMNKLLEEIKPAISNLIEIVVNN